MKRTIRFTLAALLLTLGMPCAGAVSASTISAPLSIKATVINNCLVGDIDAISMPAYDPTAATSVRKSASVNAVCTKGVKVTMTLPNSGTKLTSASTGAQLNLTWSPVNQTLTSPSVNKLLVFPFTLTIAAGQDAAAATDYSGSATINFNF